MSLAALHRRFTTGWRLGRLVTLLAACMVVEAAASVIHTDGIVDWQQADKGCPVHFTAPAHHGHVRMPDGGQPDCIGCALSHSTLSVSGADVWGIAAAHPLPMGQQTASLHVCRGYLLPSSPRAPPFSVDLLQSRA